MSRRSLIIALFVSLAVNLFVIGGLAGASLMGFRLHGGPMQGPPARLAAMGSELAPAHREAWMATLHKTAQNSGPKLREARILRRESWRGLAADPADPQAALAGLDQARGLELQARGEMDRAVVGFVAQLPSEERRKLTAALSRARPRPPGEGWSGRRPAPGEAPGALPHR